MNALLKLELHCIVDRDILEDVAEENSMVRLCFGVNRCGIFDTRWLYGRRLLTENEVLPS